MKQKWLCGIFAAFLLLSAVSCGNDGSAENTQKTSDTDTAAQTESETETSPIDTLESADYDGYEFRILSMDFTWQAYDYCVAEEITGEAVNDAIYNRTTAVADTLNVKFTEQRVGDGAACPEIRKTASASEDAYDLAFMNVGQSNALATEGLLLDLNTVKTIDLTKPWWVKSYNDYFSLNGKTYAAFGDLDLNYLGSYFVVAFTTDLVSQYNLEDPYALYENGTWTLDKMHRMMQTVSTDVDGNGDFHDFKTDIFGAVGHANQLRHLVMGSGVSLAEKDGDSYKMNISEEYVDMYNKVLSICEDPSAYFQAVKNCGENYWEIFNGGRVLFHCNTTAAFYDAREADVAYGILPFPKGDEAQKDYYSIIYNGAGSMTVPVTVADPERTGNIIEWLNGKSYGVLKDAFIESTLYMKYAQDERSVGILRKMYAGNTYCDIAFLYDWGGVSGTVEKAHCNFKDNITSELEKISEKFAADVDKTLGKTE